jgi:hypothetical protein
METDTARHSIVSLLRDLRDETATLFRQEVALAKAEMTEKSTRLARNAVCIAIGAGLVLAGVVLLLIGCEDLLFVGLLNAGFDIEVATWLSPLVVALVTGGVGWALIAKGRKGFSTEGLVPRKTVESLRKDQSWLREKVANT